MGVEDLETANIFNLLHRAAEGAGLTGRMIEGTEQEAARDKRRNEKKKKKSARGKNS